MPSTGSTSFQRQCEASLDELRKRGVLYPSSGRDAHDPAHHRFADELMRSGEQWPTRGVVAEVIDEVRASESDRVLISSEGLTLSWRNPSLLRALKEAFNELGYDVSVLLCRRELESLLPALYGSLVLHGIDMPREDFEHQARMGGIVEVPAYRHHPMKTFCLDADLLVESFERAFGRESVCVISYNPDGMMGKMTDAQIAFFGDEAELFSDARRSNVSKGDARQILLEDHLVGLRCSPVWRLTNWTRTSRRSRARLKLRGPSWRS